MAQTAIGMSRGVVVLDENLYSLYDDLKKRNMRVIKAPVHDADIAEQTVSGRILITNNSKDFVELAPEFEFGIIATEDVPNSKEAPDLLGRMISKALSDFDLWPKREAFILYLKKDGKHELKMLR